METPKGSGSSGAGYAKPYLGSDSPVALAVIVMALMAVGGCSTTQSGRNGVASGDVQEIRSRLSPEQANQITVYAIGLVGTPYRYGGNTPESGFDCSGLIGHVYQARGGVAPPRTVSHLKNWGQPVSGERIRTGDLVVFATRDVATHAGIYVGGGRFVHAPSSGGSVRLDELNSKYWSAQQVTFRRP